MRWRRKRKEEQRGDLQREDLDAALVQAKRALVDAKQLRFRADEVADKLTLTRQRNGFGAAVIRSFRGD